MTLYYEDGSKRIDKQYKDGFPIGTWKRWYENGKLWGIVEFGQTALPDYQPHSSIVKIELLYSDEDNTIRHKGEAFANKLINTESHDGSPLVMPMWDYTSTHYDEGGKVWDKNSVEIQLEDTTTGKTYAFPWN